jgi:hypothetical protein
MPKSVAFHNWNGIRGKNAGDLYATAFEQEMNKSIFFYIQWTQHSIKSDRQKYEQYESKNNSVFVHSLLFRFPRPTFPSDKYESNPEPMTAAKSRFRQEK